ncbi:MAG: DDE-type integrase/transposase/recombinase [Intestinibacter bartlettii]|uniref:DDE-type integrase/transposase/recombinase n=1 Tax=Intestinibacter bartlettii TaxID=261299 RepID=UPI00399B59AE
MDLYSRKIIAWTLSRTLEVPEVLECIKTAKRIRKTANPVIIQSDRGVHYTSNRYKKLTAGLICSYSRKGNLGPSCIDHMLIKKREWLNGFKIMDYNHAYNLIFEYLEGFYNTVEFIYIIICLQMYMKAIINQLVKINKILYLISPKY